MVYAHRGDHRGEAKDENTTLAIKRAAEIGADGVALDVRSTSGRRRPTALDAALTQVAELGLLLVLEINEEADAVEAAKLTWDRLPREQFLITSFKASALEAVNAMRLRIRTGLILSWAATRRPAAALALAQQQGAEALLAHYRRARRIIAAAHPHQIPVIPWGAANGSRLDRLPAGITGVITDEPADALDRLHGVDLAGGRRVQVRVLPPSQRQKIPEFVRMLSQRTREARFHGTSLSDRELLALDGVHVVASAGNQTIGWGMAAPRPDGHATAEVGIVVADAWQSRGVGTAVLTRLEQAVRAHLAMRGMVALVQRDNAQAQRLFGQAGWSGGRKDSGDLVFRSGTAVHGEEQ